MLETGLSSVKTLRHTGRSAILNSLFNLERTSPQAAGGAGNWICASSSSLHRRFSCSISLASFSFCDASMSSLTR